MASQVHSLFLRMLSLPELVMLLRALIHAGVMTAEVQVRHRLLAAALGLSKGRASSRAGYRRASSSRAGKSMENACCPSPSAERTEWAVRARGHARPSHDGKQPLKHHCPTLFTCVEHMEHHSSLFTCVDEHRSMTGRVWAAAALDPWSGRPARRPRHMTTSGTGRASPSCPPGTP